MIEHYEAIRRLIAIYGQLLDDKRLAPWGELFALDATFAVWGRVYVGRDEIVREIGGMQAPTPGKHVVLQPVMDLLDDEHARAWTDLTALATMADGSIANATIGRYHDDLERGTDGRWRFARRVLVMGGEPLPVGVAASPEH